MALDLGTLEGKLRFDYSDLEKAEQHAGKFASKVDKDFSRLEASGKKLKSVGKTASVASAALVGVGLSSTKMANDFNKNIAEINSLIPEAERDFKGLKDTVRGVAVALGTDLNESASAAYQAISAGVPKDNLLDFLTVATKSAVAGVTNAEVAVDGITTVTNAWGESAGSASDIADVMFTAVKNGKTTFEELSRSMFQVAGIAPELGVNFKEISAATAQMTSQGVPTSVAMTQMRASMVALSKPNKTMVSLLKAAGIESVQSSIKTKGLVGTLGKLRTAADKSNINIQEAMGGAEAMGLIFKATGKNAAGFKKNLDGMENSLGAMGSAFEEIDSQRGFDKVVNQLKAVATIVGDALLPVILPLAENFATLLSRANELDPGLVQIGVVLGAIVAAAGPVLFTIGSMMAAFGPMIASAGGFSAALGSLAAAAGPVGIAIAAIAGGAILLYQNWDIVKQFFMTLVRDIVVSFQQWAQNNEGLINSIQAKWVTFVEGAKALWSALTGAISSFVSSSVQKLNEFLAPIGGLKGAWEILKTAVGGVITFVVEQLGIWLDGVNKVIGIITDVLNGNMSVWEGLGQIIGTMVTTAISLLLNLKDKAVEIFKAIGEYLKTIDWKQLGIDIMNGLKNGIVAGAVAVKDAVVGVATGIKDSFTDFFDINSPSRVFNALGKFLTAGLAGGITEGKVDAINAAVKLAEDVMNGTKDKFKNLESEMLTGGGGFGSFGGGGDIVSNMNGIDHDMEKEKALHAQQLELLKQAEAQKIEAIRPYQEMREQLEREHQGRLQGFEQEKQQQILATADSFFGGLAQLQSSHSKKAQAVGKAAAIAQTTIKTYEGAMSAYAAMAPIPIIGPALGIAAAGAVVAMGAQNISKIRSSKAKGGNVFSGGQYRVNENGPEMLSSGGQDFLMMGKSGGSITPFEQLKGGSGGSNISVNIKVNNNFSEAAVSVTESGEGDNKTIEIAVDRAVKRVTSELDTGGTDLSRTLENRYKLGRTG